MKHIRCDPNVAIKLEQYVFQTWDWSDNDSDQMFLRALAMAVVSSGSWGCKRPSVAEINGLIVPHWSPLLSLQAIPRILNGNDKRRDPYNALFHSELIWFHICSYKIQRYDRFGAFSLGCRREKMMGSGLVKNMMKKAKYIYLKRCISAFWSGKSMALHQFFSSFQRCIISGYWFILVCILW